MMCFFYCIPLAVLAFYAVAPALALMACFAMKRGWRQKRLNLRLWGVVLLGLAAVKLLLVDPHFSQGLVCRFDLPGLPCAPEGIKRLKIAGLGLMVAAFFGLHLLYVRMRAGPARIDEISPEQNRLRLWANLALSLVCLLILWTLAPWIAALAFGKVPEAVMRWDWRPLAIASGLFLIFGFWKLEDCNWFYCAKERKMKDYAHKMWTPRDTLWTAVWLYIVTLACAYVTHDIFTPG